MVMVRRATPADAAGIARVHVDAWRATYRGIVPDEHLDALSYEGRQGMWSRILEANNDHAVFHYLCTFRLLSSKSAFVSYRLWSSESLNHNL